jgi:putative peptidoglycan lipid II flippase
MTSETTRILSRRMYRPIITITIITIVNQIINFVMQLALAALFGSNREMDAYIAAITLPNYIVTVLLSVQGAVFIPVFIDYLQSKNEEEAWNVASGVINGYLCFLGAFTVVGVLFAKQLLQLTVPGLSSSTLELSAQMATIVWPGLIATGIVMLLSSVYQATGHFAWPTTVTLIGQIVNLVLVLALSRRLGIVAVAIGATVNMFLQAILVSRIVFRPSRYRFGFYFNHPGIRKIYYLLWPLIISGIGTRITPIVERYLISGMPSGSISHLNYAFKMVELLSGQLSAGISVVIFPRMALNVSQKNFPDLKHTISLSLRLMWLAIAPAIVLGIVLALPVITVVFQRGQFSGTDSQAVASLMSIYLLALAPMCLGSVTGRSFYALQDTRTPAILGIIESIAYIGYMALLVQYLGVVGVAIGYVIYFNVSLLWQVIIIRYKTGNKGGTAFISSFAKIGTAALGAGILTYLMTKLTANYWLQLGLGAVVSGTSYILLLKIMKSQEFMMLWAVFKSQYNLLFKRA